MIKRGRKRKNDMYFGPEEEEAVIPGSFNLGLDVWLGFGNCLKRVRYDLKRD